MSDNTKAAISHILKASNRYEIFHGYRRKEDVKDSFKKFARLVHPDKAANISGAYEAFTKLRSAYELLLSEIESPIVIQINANESTSKTPPNASHSRRTESSSNKRNFEGETQRSWVKYKAKVIRKLSSKRRDSEEFLTFDDLDSCSKIESNSNNWKQFIAFTSAPKLDQTNTIAPSVVAAATTTLSSPPPPTTTATAFAAQHPATPTTNKTHTSVCVLCRRGFPNSDALNRHVLHSDLHARNLSSTRADDP